MSTFVLVLVWVLFVASSVYGHVALKLGTKTVDGESERAFWLRMAEDPWTISALVAWAASGVLWIVILRRTKLFEAMSVSTLRYALVVVAAALFLSESFDKRQALGILMITGGVFLVKS